MLNNLVSQTIATSPTLLHTSIGILSGLIALPPLILFKASCIFGYAGKYNNGFEYYQLKTERSNLFYGHEWHVTARYLLVTAPVFISQGQEHQGP
jgi:hypothetical protein